MFILRAESTEEFSDDSKGIICLNLCLRNAEFIELSLSVPTLIYEQCHVPYENEKVNFRREKVF